jgi:hypothetical protein
MWSGGEAVPQDLNVLTPTQSFSSRERQAVKRTTTAGAALTLAIFGTNVAAQTASSDRVRNIEKAAAEIGAIQKTSGANRAFATIIECYTRELAGATALSPQLEACMAQDIVVSQLTATVYSRMSAESRRMGGGADPDAVLKAMQERVLGTMTRFHVPQDDALVFSGIVKTKGMEAYARAQYPGQFPGKKDDAQPTAAPPQVANNGAIASEFTATFSKICLDSFPESGAVEALLKQNSASPLSNDEIKVALRGDPGSGWLFKGGTTNFTILINTAPVRSCAVRLSTNGLFTPGASYSALEAIFAAQKGLTMEAATQADRVPADHYATSITNTTRKPDGSRGAHTFVLTKDYFTDPHDPKKLLSVDTQLIHQISSEK